MLAIVDYGVGNLFSLRSSLDYIGKQAVVTSDPAVLRMAERIILPGVGAFGDAIEKLRAGGLEKAVRREAESGKPLMGICLGMQMLFEKSYEYGEHNGLGFIKGEVIPMENTIPGGLKIPHIGWNRLEKKKNSPILSSIGEDDYVYFVHSFYVEGNNENTVATTEYGKSITAAVQKDNIFGCQFHPEKSGDVGLAILRDFCEYRA